MRRAVHSMHIPQTTRLGQVNEQSYYRIEEEELNMGIFSHDNERGSTDKEKEFLTQIKDFVETIVILNKESTGLGIQIVGGTDTYLKGIVIKHIDPNGSAAKDGRLKTGDQILEVNGVSLREISHEKAVSAIRVASSPVRLLVFREDPEKIFTSKENPKSLIKVRINKSISECLGLSILARRDGNGVFVTYVAEGSAADVEGTIQQGDRIMEVNNINLRNATQEHAAHTLKRSYGNIKLTIGRIPSLYNSLKLSENTGQSSGHVNYGLEGESETGNSRRYRSGSHGSNDWSKRPKSKSSDENRNNIVIPKQRRSITMLETSMYYQPDPKDSHLHANTTTREPDPQSLRFSMEEQSLRSKMYETYGKEDYV